MATDIISINYPSINLGSKQSNISFIDDEVDLVKLFLENKKNPQQKRFFITDSNVASLECLQSFTNKFDDGVYENDFLMIIGSGEKSKSVETILSIVSAAIQANFTRKDIFVGIGGGVICDLVSFAASIYKRGIEVQLVPSSLLAMVDAAIGGKTSCDFGEYKNIIGTYFPASNIYYFPAFIQTLPENQYNSGLAEAFKTGLLFDKKLYQLFKDSTDKVLSRDKDTLIEIIKRSVNAKGKVASKDFLDEGIRTHLNLGHTFGNALENIAGLGAITHGAAVAWGIGRSVELAWKKEYCLQSFRDEIFSILEKYNWDTEGQPQAARGGGVGSRMLQVMHKDKKNLSEKVRIVLLKGIEDSIVEEVEDNDILAVLK
ncbi:MAG: 3-dehydroquinate synthase [Treponema sp.]|nr:3-dehydroquinate synthase [Treponema sp.]